MMLGFDLELLEKLNIDVPVTAPTGSHLICVGGTGSGKSTALIYFLYKCGCDTGTLDLWICDAKNSGEFEGISSHYATGSDCGCVIEAFRDLCQTLPEGGNGKVHILLVDEIAGLLTLLSSNKDGKAEADRIRAAMAYILMIGRSRRCFLWLAMQRYSATIFPASSGAADNFQICIGLGRLTVDGRKGLFAGEHFDGEADLSFGRGRGLVLIDGQPLRGLVIPEASKARLRALIQRDSAACRAERRRAPPCEAT